MSAIMRFLDPRDLSPGIKKSTESRGNERRKEKAYGKVDCRICGQICEEIGVAARGQTGWKKLGSTRELAFTSLAIFS